MLDASPLRVRQRIPAERPLLARAMDPARQRARLIKEVNGMQGHYIVCGLGRIGANVARELSATGHRYVAIEPTFVQSVGRRPAVSRWCP